MKIKKCRQKIKFIDITPVTPITNVRNDNLNYDIEIIMTTKHEEHFKRLKSILKMYKEKIKKVQKMFPAIDICVGCNQTDEVITLNELSCIIKNKNITNNDINRIKKIMYILSVKYQSIENMTEEVYEKYLEKNVLELKELLMMEKFVFKKYVDDKIDNVEEYFKLWMNGRKQILIKKLFYLKNHVNEDVKFICDKLQIKHPLDIHSQIKSCCIKELVSNEKFKEIAMRMFVDVKKIKICNISTVLEKLCGSKIKISDDKKYYYIKCNNLLYNYFIK